MLVSGLGWLALSTTVPAPVRWMHGAASGWLLLTGLADCLPRRWRPLTVGLRVLAFLWLLGGLIGYGSTTLTGGPLP